MPFCRNCGKEIDDDVRFCPKCGTPATASEAGGYTENIKIDYPQTESAKLEITLGAAGYIELSPGASKFVEGIISYDTPEWKPHTTTIGDTVRIEQRQEIETYFYSNFRNRWNLKLGEEKPFSLDIRAGAGKAHWNIGGLPITRMYLSTGAGSHRITFNKSNPSTMKGLEVKAGAGEISLDGLLDANLENLGISGGVGSVDLDFSGEKLRRSMYVSLENGVGSLQISIKEGVATKVRIRGLSTVSAGGSFYRSGGGFGDSEYRTREYDAQPDPRLDLNIGLGVGSVSLRTVN